jgi:1-phosphatidylinositol-4-phosphate 5-kinase
MSAILLFTVLGNVDPHDLLKLQRWRKKKRGGASSVTKSYVKGKVIDGEHELYTLSLAVMIGVRQSISRTSIAQEANNGKRWVKIQDFRTTEKYEFRPKGDGSTPPHLLAHTFKFKDYSPIVFNYLRRMYGVNEFDFLLSVCGNANFIEFISNAKSGQFFFYSSDGKYMIKTMTNAESKFLRRILPQYFKHCCENPNTMMTRFFGMYRVKLYHLRRNVKFVIMNSVYFTDKPLHSFYDLKGSSLGRDAKPGQVVLKDNDLRRSLPDGALALQADQFEAVKKQVHADCDFLEAMEIMDYSMLVGVHHMPHTDQPSNSRLSKETNSRISKSQLEVSVCDSPIKPGAKSPTSSSRLFDINKTPLTSTRTHRRKLSLKNLSFDDGLDDDDSSYLAGSIKHPSYSVAGSVSIASNEDTERKKRITIEKVYWPFHLWFDIHGHRRVVPAEKPYDVFSEEDRKILKGYNIPEFVRPPSDRKDGGYEMDCAGFALPLKVKDSSGKERLCSGKLFYMGIIDVLQEYTARKSLETTYRSLLNSGKSADVSCVPPSTYGARFVSFFDEYARTPPKQDEYEC